MSSIKIRARHKDGITTVKTLISHPMETGLRKDKKTGKKIPPHFIQEVECKHNGELIMTAFWGPSVSKNPYMSFKFNGGKIGDSISISWQDNRSQRDSAEKKIS